MQISTIKNPNFEKRLGTYLIGAKWTFWKKKFFFGYFSEKLVPHMLSHRETVRTSKLWQKSKEKKRNIFSKIYQGHIRIWFRSKNFKIISPLNMPYFPAIPQPVLQNLSFVPADLIVMMSPISSAACMLRGTENIYIKLISKFKLLLIIFLF
jgi:hypothetical protein